MPYNTNEDLPKELKEIFPEGAQTLYRETYNLALDRYRSPEDARTLAWKAVRGRYEQNIKGEWVKKPAPSKRKE